MKKHLFFIFFTFFTCGINSSAFPQASVNVSTLDPVYRDIDKLVAHGLIDKIIVGQRPYSRKEVARLTAEAMKNMGRLEKPLSDPKVSEGKKQSLQSRKEYVDRILKRLQKDYREELIQLKAIEGEKSWYALHPAEKAEVEITILKSPPEALIPNNGIGVIDAVINPFVDYREGRHYVDGGNFSVETTHWARVTDYLAFYFRPRFQIEIGRNAPSDNNVYVQNLYGKLNIKNFEIEVGRDNLFWGQGQNAGILLSNNPRGLDMFKLSNDSPGILPWIFKYLGAHKLSFFWANLGPDQFFPHSYLTGYKYSIEILPLIELGAAFMLESGGEGSPDASFGRRVRQVFLFYPEPFNDDLSNKVAGLDIRFRIPPLRGAELYGEAMYDDRHQIFFSHAQLVDDASYIGGFWFPRLLDDGSLDLRLEYHRTGKRFYRHGTFQTGLTLNHFIVGDNLGPNAQGIYGTMNWDVTSNDLLTFHGAFEMRGSDIFAVDDPFLFDFKVVQPGPDEKRFRATAQWLRRMKGLPMNLKVQLGYERVQNFNFIQGNNRNNFMGELALQIFLDQWTRFPR